MSVPLSQCSPRLRVPMHAGARQAATPSCPAPKEGWHIQGAAAGCTCCLSSGNWCSRSSPCSRCPGVPCRLSWTYTHSRDMSVGNKRERCALMRVKGNSGYFPYFLPGCSSQPWQEWAQALSLLCQRIDPSQAFVPPSQGGQGQSRTPHAHQGSPSPLLADGEAPRSWMGSAAVWMWGGHTHQIQPCCHLGG